MWKDFLNVLQKQFWYIIAFYFLLIVFKKSIWKSSINPYGSENVLKLLAVKSPDSDTIYPAISEFSFASIPHPRGENLKAEQTIKHHMARIMTEYAQSTDYLQV